MATPGQSAPRWKCSRCPLAVRSCLWRRSGRAWPPPPLMAQPKMPPPPVKDFKAAARRDPYALDPGAHPAWWPGVPHMGFSFEVFQLHRRRRQAGTWDPANPGADTLLSVTVDPKSMTTAPTGAVDFAAELTGDKYLNVAKFPTATFVSETFPRDRPDPRQGRRRSDHHGRATKPAVFDVELVGARPRLHRRPGDPGSTARHRRRPLRATACRRRFASATRWSWSSTPSSDKAEGLPPPGEGWTMRSIGRWGCPTRQRWFCGRLRASPDPTLSAQALSTPREWGGSLHRPSTSFPIASR